jgi:integrase/recombinase XerD
MSQAKVLTQDEIEKMLGFLNTKKHASRNRAMFLLSHGCGVRIKELVSIRIADVLTRDGQIREEINLNREQTKGAYVKEAN